MENTLENKAKFFAQYWGQRVVLKNESISSRLYQMDRVVILHCETHTLELKPLSSISDEDASSIRGFINKGDFLFYLNKSTSITTFIEGNLYFKDVDFLRSCGYALPYMGLSVEELVNRGWIKMKGETK